MLALASKITKMITSMEVAAAAAAAAAEVVAEVEWWRAEVAVTEVVRPPVIERSGSKKSALLAKRGAQSAPET